MNPKQQIDNNEEQVRNKKKDKQKTIFWCVFFLLLALIYSISPWDIVPDMLGPFGFTDDIVVWAVVIGKEISILLKKYSK